MRKKKNTKRGMTFDLASSTQRNMHGKQCGQLYIDLGNEKMTEMI